MYYSCRICGFHIYLKQILIECHTVFLIPCYFNILTNIFSPSSSSHNKFMLMLACMDDLSHAQTHDNKFNYKIELHKHIIYCLAPRDLKSQSPHHRRLQISFFVEQKYFIILSFFHDIKNIFPSLTLNVRFAVMYKYTWLING